MEGGRVLAERDDVLVRRLPVVLPRGLEEKQVQIQLGRVARAEGVPQGLVSELRSRVGLGDACDLVRRLRGAQGVERFDEPAWALTVFAHERDAARPMSLARGALPVHIHDLEGSLERGRLRRGRFLPEAALRGTQQDRLASRAHDEAAPGLGEGQPVLEVRAGAQRPVLVVELAPQSRLARLDDDGVPPLRVEHPAKAELEVGHVREIEGVEVRGGAHGGSVPQRRPGRRKG